MSVLLRPEFPALPQPMLSEADIITADLCINLRALKAIALRKAEQWPVDQRDFGYRHELHALRLLAEAMIENRKAQRAAEQGSPKERLIRSLELRLEILRNGLAQPRDAEAIKHYESLLADARAAAPDSADVRLAALLQAAE